MKRLPSVLVAMTVLAYATPVAAQNNTNTDTTIKVGTPTVTDSGPAKAAAPSMVQEMVIQRLRPVDARGINVYEAPKNDGVPYTGFKLGWGAAFTQQFQGLEHSNTATPVLKSNINSNQLMSIGHGFNNAVANLYLNAQLARGVRVAMSSYLSTPYSYLSMTKHSMYVDEHAHEGQEGTRLTIAPGGSKYLFVYPFVKTRAWYMLPMDERQRMMTAHITMGHKYPTVKINTTYSFGLDDQEFVLAFETDYPADFLDLVQDLRGTEASSFTLRDTPIFTCVNTEVREILRALNGQAAARPLAGAV